MQSLVLPHDKKRARTLRESLSTNAQWCEGLALRDSFRKSACGADALAHHCVDFRKTAWQRQGYSP
jgi:hypothetical protein